MIIDGNKLEQGDIIGIGINDFVIEGIIKEVLDSRAIVKLFTDNIISVKENEILFMRRGGSQLC